MYICSHVTGTMSQPPINTHHILPGFVGYVRYNHSIMQHGRQYRTKKCIGQSLRGSTLCFCSKTWVFGHVYIDSLVLDCSISVANALEILQYCTKPSITIYVYWIIMAGIYRRDRHRLILALWRTENWWNVGIHINLVLCLIICNKYIMTSSNGNIIRVTGHLCGEFTGHRWIPRTKACDAELWYILWSAPE